MTKVEVQVKPEDLDELNHVNNVVYMRWLEMAAQAARMRAGPPSAISGKAWAPGSCASTGSNIFVTANWVTSLRSIPGCRSFL